MKTFLALIVLVLIVNLVNAGLFPIQYQVEDPRLVTRSLAEKSGLARGDWDLQLKSSMVICKNNLRYFDFEHLIFFR